MRVDYYQILGIDRKAGSEEIKRAYRRLARRYHPDRNTDNPAAEDRFKEVQEAFDVLSDPKKRSLYDIGVKLPFAGKDARNVSLDDLIGGVGQSFSEFFGGIFGGKKRTAARGPDVDMGLNLTFREAVLGTERTAETLLPTECPDCGGAGGREGAAPKACPDCEGTGQRTIGRSPLAIKRVCETCNGLGIQVSGVCPTCDGIGMVTRQGEVTIVVPPGTSDQEQIRIEGMGELGRGGAGDLVVAVEVQEHPFLRRRERDIHLDLPVTFPEAVLGATISVPTVHGPVDLKLPPGTGCGSKLRLKGKGVPAQDGKSGGDQYVAISVHVPKDLGGEGMRLVEELAGVALPEPRKHLVDG